MAFLLKCHLIRRPSLSYRKPAFWFVAPVALAAILIAALPALADLSDISSPHNFTGTGEPFINKGGVCSPCHWMHYGQDGIVRTWPRNLGSWRTYFDQTANPDYLPDSARLSTPTLLCYDCHIGTSPPPELEGQQITGWAEDPQDIAFTDGPPESGGTATGYYELSDGTIPDTGNPAPTDGSPTGGHFWKSEPTGTPDYAQGDKLACSICHDPHDSRTGSNEALFLTSTPDGGGGFINLGDGRKASSNSRNGTGDGRDMCAACHGLSDQGTPVTMWGVTLPAPPATVTEHSQSSGAQCTSCHPHNFVTPSAGDCESCHGSAGPGPNVLTYWDGSWWDINMGNPGDTATNQGGHGDPDERPALACTDCHDTGDPPTGSGRHLNGILNSTGGTTGTRQNASTNTAHLLPAWIGSGSPGVQTTLDAACYGCHNSPWFLNDHSALTGWESHSVNSNTVQFGLPLPPASTTYADGESISPPWPVDSDISTNAGTSEPDYAPCVTCHDPHGTGITDHKNLPSNNSNFMLRGDFLTDPDYCKVCHI